MATSTNEKIYLSKNGQIEGPFNTQDVDALKAQGKYKEYSWIWTAQVRQWVAINPPPAPPGEAPTPTVPTRPDLSGAASVSRVSAPAESVASSVTSVPPIADKGLEEPWPALCHDQVNILQGYVTRYSTAQGTFETRGRGGLLTPFGKGCRVWVNVLDQKHGRSDNVEARVGNVNRSGDHWVIEVLWDRPLRLLET